MNLLGYGLIGIGVILLGMGFLSLQWKQRAWLRLLINGLILIAAGAYFLLYRAG